MKCAIFYGDGYVYEGDAMDAPGLNAQVVIYNDSATGALDSGRVVLHGWDFYLLERDAWVGINSAVDLVDHLLNSMPDKIIKGRMLPKNEWQSVIERANAYPGFRARSAEVPKFERPSYDNRNH